MRGGSGRLPEHRSLRTTFCGPTRPPASVTRSTWPATASKGSAAITTTCIPPGSGDVGSWQGISCPDLSNWQDATLQDLDGLLPIPCSSRRSRPVSRSVTSTPRMTAGKTISTSRANTAPLLAARCPRCSARMVFPHIRSRHSRPTLSNRRSSIAGDSGFSVQQRTTAQWRLRKHKRVRQYQPGLGKPGPLCPDHDPRGRRDLARRSNLLNRLAF